LRTRSAAHSYRAEQNQQRRSQLADHPFAQLGNPYAPAGICYGVFLGLTLVIVSISVRTWPTKRWLQARHHVDVTIVARLSCQIRL
jgi:hypothetical protein